MYVPPAFRLEDTAEIRAALASFPLASFVTAGAEGLMATPLPRTARPQETAASARDRAPRRPEQEVSALTR